MTPEQIAATVKTALNAALADIGTAGSVTALDYDEIPGGQYGHTPGGKLPARYVAIDVSRRYVEARRYSGDVVLPGFRLGTRYCATTVSDVREIQRRVWAALEGQILPDDLGPFDFEVAAEDLHADDYGFTAVDDWTFATA